MCSAREIGNRQIGDRGLGGLEATCLRKENALSYTLPVQVCTVCAESAQPHVCVGGWPGISILLPSAVLASQYSHLLLESMV